MAEGSEIRAAVLGRFAEAEDAGELDIRVQPVAIADVCAYLKADFAFNYLMSLTAVDWSERFEVVYHLYSISEKHHITLRVPLSRDTDLPSVTSVWRAANWQEREVYDMFGIEFTGHPDLTRILLEPDWVGFPLRKDYGKE